MTRQYGRSCRDDYILGGDAFGKALPARRWRMKRARSLVILQSVTEICAVAAMQLFVSNRKERRRGKNTA
jgi:hypothetical protein